MRIAVIPARGGSKRIPRKNIKPFAGLPMIAHSLREAHESQLFDHVLVSSDDDEILAVGTQYGGEPLSRPPELAGDHVATIPVIRHAVQWAELQGWELDGVCCIYAAAPFVHADDLRRGWEMLCNRSMDFTFSATTFDAAVFRALLQDGEGVRMMFPEHSLTRTQDLPEAIHDAGQFYWGTPDAWKQQDHLFTARAAPIMLPRYRVQDIDTPEDWRRAETIWRTLGDEGLHSN